MTRDATSPRRHVDGLPVLDRCLVMGIVNVTPDSFSDGGLYFHPEAAIRHGRTMAAHGADLVDVGGESTRPGARRPKETQELDRVLPVIRKLAADGITVSVDTMRASVAEAAVAAGAAVVNDVSGGRADPEMFATVARLGVPYVLMHWRAHSEVMQQLTTYDDVVGDVVKELREQLEAAVAAGVDPARIALDPGIGFAKTADQNWEVLAGLGALHDLGQPLILATSRKRFLGELLAGPTGLRPPQERDDATTATTALAAAEGVWCVRVHDVLASADAVRVTARWFGPEEPPVGSAQS
jgi:dihydropteroate synthase